MSEEKGNIYAPTEVRVDDVHTEGDLQMATRSSRLGAAIVDGLVFGMPAFFLTYVWIASLLGIDAFAEMSMLNELTITAIYFAIYFAFFAAANWVWLERSGQSLGKKLMSIRIVRSDGTPVGARHALFVRSLPIWVLSMVPFVGPLVGFVDVLMIFRESRKCLHDNIADTIVIKA